MNNLLKIVSYVALVATIVPAVLFMAGMMNLNTVQIVALVGTAGWFATTPFWMGRETPVDADQVEI